MLPENYGWAHLAKYGYKKSLAARLQGFRKKWRRHTLPDCGPVPSALVSLTSLFGMGRGGPHCYNRLNLVMLGINIMTY